MESHTQGLAEIIGGATIALSIVAVGFQKIIKGWKSDSAETSVISLMHEELMRLSAQNSKLSEELNKLQMELINLNSELQKLTAENQRLHFEVGSLTSEISRLKSMLDERNNNGNRN